MISLFSKASSRPQGASGGTEAIFVEFASSGLTVRPTMSAVRVTTKSDLRDYVEDNGGVLYVTTHRSRCCASVAWVTASTTPAEGDDGYEPTVIDGMLVCVRARLRPLPWQQRTRRTSSGTRRKATKTPSRLMGRLRLRGMNTGTESDGRSR
jgi:hypothetical protein